MSELHLSQYDDEEHFTIEAHDSEAANILKALEAKHVRDNLYRLPINQIVPFLAQRFKLDVVGGQRRHRRPPTEAQREARRKSLEQVRARRWTKTES